MSDSPILSAFHCIEPSPKALYALVDSARESEAVYQARQARCDYESLFEGPMGKLLEEVAPYLIAFQPGSSFEAWWFEQWGNSIGVLVEAPVGLNELRRHFRTLTIAKGEEQKKYYFRFYDPRVLRVFLPACTGDELRHFFGPVHAFHCESANGTSLLTFRPAQDGVEVKESHAKAPRR